jgi:hypothetical protein
MLNRFSIVDSIALNQFNLFENTNFQMCKAQVVFGSPNKNCAGSGICKTIAPSMGTNHPFLLHCDHALAVIVYRLPDVLHFYFEKKSICNRILKKHFEQNIFLVEEPFLFECPKNKALLQIRAGAYIVQESEEHLFIPFAG